MMRRILLACALATPLACHSQTTNQAVRGLGAECVSTSTHAPDGAWLCGESQTMECGSDPSALDQTVYVVSPPLGSGQPVLPNGCTPGETLEVVGPDDYSVGDHAVRVYRPATGKVGAAELICESTISVVDTTVPVVTRTATLALWPPNHKLRAISISDCVSVEDVCDEDVSTYFTWASSDEAVDARGDGHHAPDIVNLGCDSVSLRAERQGGSNGRIYHLGWRAADDSGNAVEGVCTVFVHHDQSGRTAIDDGESYRVELTSAAMDCESNDGDDSSDAPPVDGEDPADNPPPADGDGTPADPNPAPGEGDPAPNPGPDTANDPSGT